MRTSAAGQSTSQSPINATTLGLGAVDIGMQCAFASGKWIVGNSRCIRACVVLAQFQMRLHHHFAIIQWRFEKPIALP